MSTPTIRPPALRKADPLAFVISSVVALLAAAGVLAKLGLDAETIVALESTLFAIAAFVRHVLEKRNDARLRDEVQQLEAQAFAAGVEQAAPGGHENTPAA